MWQIIDYPLPLRLPCWLAALSALSLRWQVLIVLLSPSLLLLLLNLLFRGKRLRRLIYPIRRLVRILAIALMRLPRF